MTIQKPLPTQIAFFLICCFIPQWVSGNGIIQGFIKIVILLSFASKVIDMRQIRYPSMFVFIYSALYCINVFIAAIFYGGNIIGLAQAIIITIVTLLLFYQIPKRTDYLLEEDILAFYKVYVLFIAVSCLYNIIINFYALLHITSLSVYGGAEIKSFFDNKNTFGVFLLFGVLAAAILKVRTRNNKWGFLIALFMINELMAMCRTAMLISVIIIAISFVVDNKNRVRNVLLLALLCAFIYLIIVKMYSVNPRFLDSISNTQSMDDREQLIRALLPLMHGSVLLTGYGSTMALNLAGIYTGIRYYHNTYLQIFVEGGIPKILLFASTVIISITYSLRVRKYDRSVSNICLLSLIVYLIYAYVEAVPLFESPIVSMTATVFTVSIPIFWYNSIDNCQKG